MTLDEALKKLKSENCPAGLRLNLGWSDIGNEGAKALAYALKSGNCPSGLKLNLKYNDIGDKGSQAFSDVLASGSCPSGLKLNKLFPTSSASAVFSVNKDLPTPLVTVDKLWPVAEFLFLIQTKSGSKPTPVIDCVPPLPAYNTALKFSDGIGGNDSSSI